MDRGCRLSFRRVGQAAVLMDCPDSTGVVAIAACDSAKLLQLQTALIIHTVPQCKSNRRAIFHTVEQNADSILALPHPTT